jgi:ribosomal protein L7/L12
MINEMDKLYAAINAISYSIEAGADSELLIKLTSLAHDAAWKLDDARMSLQGELRTVQEELSEAKSDSHTKEQIIVALERRLIAAQGARDVPAPAYDAPLWEKADYLRKLIADDKLKPWAAYGDRKIQMIKDVRALSGWGLREAKDAVEAIWGWLDA